MENEVIFKNNLISLEYDDNRFAMYDSDGKYIDYLFYLDVEEDPKQLQEEYIRQVKYLNEKQLTEWIKNTFNVLKLDPECSKKDILDLEDTWGDEWVYRIGNTGVILKEI